MTDNQKQPRKGNTYDIATRAQIVTLKTYTSLSNDQISAITGADPRQIQRYAKAAKDRGYQKGEILRDSHVANVKSEKVGRPRKNREVNIAAVLDSV